MRGQCILYVIRHSELATRTLRAKGTRTEQKYLASERDTEGLGAEDGSLEESEHRRVDRHGRLTSTKHTRSQISARSPTRPAALYKSCNTCALR